MLSHYLKLQVVPVVLQFLNFSNVFIDFPADSVVKIQQILALAFRGWSILLNCFLHFIQIVLCNQGNSLYGCKARILHHQLNVGREFSTQMFFEALPYKFFSRRKLVKKMVTNDNLGILNKKGVLNSQFHLVCLLQCFLFSFRVFYLLFLFKGLPFYCCLKDFPFIDIDLCHANYEESKKI